MLSIIFSSINDNLRQGLNARIFFLTLLSFFLCSFTSCAIEGEEICGIWNTSGDYGEIEVEITPWKGQFYGYLLAYKNKEKVIVGSKTEEFIFITDLVFKNGNYQDGKIYLDPNSETYCDLKLKLLDPNQVQAIYNCDGQNMEETWYRKGFNGAKKTSPSKVENTAMETAKIQQESTSKSVATKKNKKELAVENSPKEKIASTITPPSSPAPNIENETTRESSFNIIGIQELVNYEDTKGLEATIEVLWTKAYNNDFSNELKNIIDPNTMYLSYSGYGQPKGKMAITLGYKVSNLSTIPAGLKGVKIPSNEYLTYPLSGDKSDYEGEGWEQLGELMMYRKADSADFEVYSFDNNYKVKKATMWIATK